MRKYAIYSGARIMRPLTMAKATSHCSHRRCRPCRCSRSQLPPEGPVPQEVEKKEPADPDWEQRRFELMKMLLAQERRSVVLGMLQASNKQIANTARVLADAGIRELMNHPMEESHDTRREANAE